MLHCRWCLLLLHWLRRYRGSHDTLAAAHSRHLRCRRSTVRRYVLRWMSRSHIRTWCYHARYWIGLRYTWAAMVLAGSALVLMLYLILLCQSALSHICSVLLSIRVSRGARSVAPIVVLLRIAIAVILVESCLVLAVSRWTIRY